MNTAIDHEERLGGALEGYRPHLDGLRAVAVYLVVLFHAGVDRFAGGFIGVDVFFVLSGFLVTKVVLTGRAAGSSLWHFYARRVRRLLPAAVLAIVGALALYSVVATPAELLSVEDGFRAALLYFSNWFFIAQSTDYFAGDVAASPVLHFWSLSIEEQFYLLWPLVLLGALAIRTRLAIGMWAIRIGVAGLAALSLVWALHLASDDINRAYYGTDARAYQLLAGAFLALTPAVFDRVRSVRWVGRISHVAILALVVLGTSVLDLNPIQRGALATVATVVLLVSLETGASATKQFLSTRPMTYLGQISYGTYLWHWPIIVAAGLVLDVSPMATVVLASVAATGVAALSSQLVEIPIRQSLGLHRIPRTVITTGLATSVLVALVVVPRLAEPDRPPPIGTGEIATSEVSGTKTPTKGIDWVSASNDKVSAKSCFDKSPEACVLRRGNGRHITLVGDSHAVAWMAAFERMAVEHDLTLSVAVEPGCPWPVDLRDSTQEPATYEFCQQQRLDWYGRVIPALDPDIVVLAIRAPDDTRRLVSVFDKDGKIVKRPAGIADIVLTGARPVVDDLRAAGRKVVLLEPIPVAPGVDPLNCLSAPGFVQDCAFDATPGPSRLEEGFRSLAAGDDGVFSVDMDRIVCPALPRCDAVIGGIVVRWDATHITATFSNSIAEQVLNALESAGVGVAP